LESGRKDRKGSITPVNEKKKKKQSTKNRKVAPDSSMKDNSNLNLLVSIF
jgi:hypothetical protein